MSEGVTENIVSPGTFNRLVDERKTERKKNAEQLRQLNSQRISDLKSKVGIDPLDHFPKEIWKMILDRLSAKDKGSMCQIHETFQGLIENTKIGEVLFPQIVGEQVDIDSSTDDASASQQRRPFASFKNLRGVCKSLRNAVDTYTETNLLSALRIEHNDGSYYQPEFSFSFSDYQRTHNAIKDLVSGVETERPKRFFCRSLSVSFYPNTIIYAILLDLIIEDCVEFFNEIKTDIKTFLEFFGTQIWRFHFEINEIEELKDLLGFSLANVYTMLQGWLTLMPNLKWLELGLESCDWALNDEDITNSVDKALAENPVPKLNHLERIDLSMQTWNTDIIQICENFLTANNEHIQILRLSGEEYSWGRIAPDIIKSLNLEAISLNEFNSSKMNSIKSPLNLKWPLKKIKLKLTKTNGSGDDASLTISSVFKLLQNFPTLERLDLDLTAYLNIGDGLSFLRLPNLTHVSFMMPDPTKCDWNRDFHFLYSLQFLLYCGKLKSIGWDICCDKIEKFRSDMEKYHYPEATIEFCGGCEDLCHSNIWKIFPGLEDIEIDTFDKPSRTGRMHRKKYCKGSLVTQNVFNVPPSIEVR